MSAIQGNELFNVDKEVDALLGKLISIEAEMNKIVATGAQLTKALAGAKVSSAGGQSTILNAAKDADKLTAAMERLKVVQSGTQAELVKVRQQTASLNREQQAQAKLANAAKGSYDALSASMAVNIIRLHAMENGTSKSNKAAQDLTKTIAQQRAELKRLDAQGGQTGRNVGNYFGDIIRSAKQLLAVYLSISGVQALISGIFGQTKALNSLDFALQKVLGNEKAVADSHAFLSQTSKDLGIDLLTLSKGYLKFTASTINAGIAQDKSNKIFTSFAKAGSAIGLTDPQFEQVFLALEQIASKGTVQTQELKRQLGEVLPGAFEIFGKALAPNLKDFTKLLETGQILATDALPKMAVAIEQAYGIENTKKINTLSAAQGRFTSSITELISRLDSAGKFHGFFDALTKGVTFISDHLSAIYNLGKAVLYIAAAYATWKLSLIATNALSVFSFANGLKDITLKNLQVAATLRLEAATLALNKAVKANPVGLVLTAVVLLVEAYSLLSDKISKTKQLQLDISEAQAKSSAEVINQKFQIDALLSSYGDEKTTLQEKKVILEKLNDIGVKVIDSNHDQKISIDELTQATDEYLKKLTERTETELLLEKRKDAVRAREDLKEKVKQNNDPKDPRGVALPLAIDKIFGTTFTDVGKKAAIDQYDAYINSLDEEIKKRGNFVDIIGGSQSQSTPPDKKTGNDDAFKDLIKRFKDLNALQEDGRKKDLEALRINILEKQHEYKNDVEVLIALEQYKRNEIAGIEEKYLSIGVKASKKRADEERSTLEKIANSITDFYKKKFSAEAATRKQFRTDYEDEYQATKDFNEKKFDLEKHSKLEIDKHNIEKDIEYYKHKLDIQKQFGGELTDLQIKQYDELISLLESKRDGLTSDKKAPQDLFDVFGITFKDDAQKEALTSTFDFAKSQLQSYFDLKKQLTDQAVADSDREVQAAQENLRNQIDLAKLGYADNVQDAERDLKLKKKQQADALKLRQKQQKDELLINTIMESSNLVLAISKVAATGGVLAAPLIAVLLGTFALAKIKAFSLVKKQFRKGTYQEIGGGSHESGKDTYVGQVQGGAGFAEKNESLSVFTAEATRRYRPTLKQLTQAANRGKLEDFMMRQSLDGGRSYHMNNNFSTGVMESELRSIRKQGEKDSGHDHLNRYYEKVHNRKTIYS